MCFSGDSAYTDIKKTKEHLSRALESNTSGFSTDGFLALTSGFFCSIVRFAFCWSVSLLVFIMLCNWQAGMKCPQMCLLFHPSWVLSLCLFFSPPTSAFSGTYNSLETGSFQKMIALYLAFRFADCGERNPCSLNAQAPDRGLFLPSSPGSWVLAARHRQRNEP